MPFSPIYLDYSATTPPRPEVIELVHQTLAENWGNASSLHRWGSRAAWVLERARLQVATLLNVPDPDTIVFTSGGTEANNLALFGVTRCYKLPQHLIISSVEHSAISEPVRYLESQGWQVTRLGVDRQGRVHPQDLAMALQPNTVLVSIIYGQSEVGTLQPIPELAALARRQGVLFHTDAVQVAGRLPLDLAALPVDLLSLSGHKFYGIQGAGALYVRGGLTLPPLLLGGGQERQLRSGTQAIAAIAALGLAAELAQQELPTETERLTQLRDYLFAQLADCPLLTPSGDRHYRLPHHLSFVVNPPLTGKKIVRALDALGIGISAGTACHSGKLQASPILLALGYSLPEALGGIRLTLGRQTTRADLDHTAQQLKEVIHQSRLSLHCS